MSNSVWPELMTWRAPIIDRRDRRSIQPECSAWRCLLSIACWRGRVLFCYRAVKGVIDVKLPRTSGSLSADAELIVTAAEFAADLDAYGRLRFVPPHCRKTVRRQMGRWFCNRAGHSQRRRRIRRAGKWQLQPVPSAQCD